MKKIVLTGLMMTGLYLSVTAQEIIMDPVTVISSLTRQKVSQTGRNIIVVKGELFNQLPVHSIDELIRYLPGIEVQMRGPMGSQSDILIRGGTFQQVLVVLDGIRLNDPLTGHFNSYIPISPGEIDHIEILKGSSSAIYGSEAVGGVIHIITKTFAVTQNMTQAQCSGKITTGQYGLFSANAGGFLQKKNTALSAAFLTNQASGQQQRGIRGYFHNTTLSASLKKFLGTHWSLGIRAAYDIRDFAAQNFYTSFTSDTATEKVNSLWTHGRVSFKKEKQSFSLDAGYKQTKDEYHFTRSFTPNLNRSHVLQAQALYNYQFSPNTNMGIGASMMKEYIRSNDRGDHSLLQSGVFITWNQKVHRSLNIGTTVRANLIQPSGLEFIPQLNLSYNLTHFIFRGSIGRSIRDADFTERYNNYNKTLVTSGNIGNPELKEESSWSYEAGADYFTAGSFKISVTGFHKQYSRLIDWVQTAYADMPRKSNLVPNGNYFLAKNISRVKTTGLEMDIQLNKQIKESQSIFTTLGMTWLQSKSSTPSLYISSHANLLINFNVAYRYKRWQMAITGIYKSRPAQSGNAALAPLSKNYFIMNASLGADILKDKLTIFLQSDNLFDHAYADRFGSPMPGSWWSGGISFKLERK